MFIKRIFSETIKCHALKIHLPVIPDTSADFGTRDSSEKFLVDPIIYDEVSESRRCDSYDNFENDIFGDKMKWNGFPDVSYGTPHAFQCEKHSNWHDVEHLQRHDDHGKMMFRLRFV